MSGLGAFSSICSSDAAFLARLSALSFLTMTLYDSIHIEFVLMLSVLGVVP